MGGGVAIIIYGIDGNPIYFANMPILKNSRGLHFIVFVAVSIFLSACNVQKHYHSSGFHLNLLGKTGRNDLPVATQGRQSVKMRQGQSPIAREKNESRATEVILLADEHTANKHEKLEEKSSISALENEKRDLGSQGYGIKPVQGKKMVVGTEISNNKTATLNASHSTKKPEPTLLDWIGLILALLGFGTWGSSSNSGYGGGSNVDWTVVFSIAAAVIGVAGLITILAVRKTMDSATLSGILVFFGVFGAPVGIIGLIKSIRDYYDVGIWLSAGGLVMLALMFLVGLI